MLADIFGWVSFFLLCGSAFLVARYYLRNRLISTKLLAAASLEFFDNSEKLMKTSEELPEPVLTAMQTMLDCMNNGQGSMVLYRMLRKTSISDFKQPPESDLDGAFEELRPELKEFFGNIVAAWLSFITHRNFVFQFLISTEMMKIAAVKETSSVDRRSAGMDFLPRLQRAAC